MNYLALYRKYRPQTLEEFFGQENIVKIVKNSISNNKFFHAYLFSGPRGTGKTTMAKLIAKLVNCSNIKGFDACEKCDSCVLINEKSNPDVIEIDAASNNGVDEIRVINDKVVLMPGVSKYKIYIIDEVHMLSISAFNALLKTLEEPPEHVIFILTTTELYKVPETIISRCQCYEFERLSMDNIVSCLKNICEKEDLKVSDDVLFLIAKYCNGGMRDSISLLDKLCSCNDEIDSNLFYNVVGIVNDTVINEMIDKIVNKDVEGLFEILKKLEKNGKNMSLMLEQMLERLKELVVNKGETFELNVILKVLEETNQLYMSIKYAANVFLAVEVGLIKVMNSFENERIISREIIADDNNVLGFTEKTKFVKDLEVESEQNVEKNTANIFENVINNAFALANKNLKRDIVDKWKGFYDYVHNKEFSSVVSYFLDSTVEVVGEKDVIVSVQYSSIVENAIKNIAKLELLFSLVMGKYYNIAFVIEDDWKNLKNKYIKDLKNNVKYEYIEVMSKNNDIIENEKQELPEVVVFANEIFGSDIVEFK